MFPNIALTGLSGDCIYYSWAFWTNQSIRVYLLAALSAADRAGLVNVLKVRIATSFELPYFLVSGHSLCSFALCAP